MRDDKDIIESILGQTLPLCEEAEIFQLSHWDESVTFEANNLKMVECRESSGFAVRLIKNGKVGFSSTNNLEDTQALLSNAIETAPFGAEASIEFPSYTNFTPVNVYDKNVESEPVETLIELGQNVIEKVLSNEPELLCDADVTRGITTITIMNSRGGYANYTKSIFSISLSGTLIKNTDMFFVGDGEISCAISVDSDHLANSIIWQLENGRNIAKPMSGDMEVLFTPNGVGAALLAPLLSGFSGKAVLEGSSPLVEKLDEQLLDKRISIWDDPGLNLVPGSRMCDDEGVPTNRMALIDRGIISNFLYDLQTAGQAGTSSTGNAHRSLNSLPTPGISVTVMSNGQDSFDDMVHNMKNGIIVESLLGVGQSNILGGDFKANVLLGYHVSNGQIVGRLKDTVIDGNVYTVLKELAGIGGVSKWVGGSLKTPSVYCHNVSVATKN